MDGLLLVSLSLVFVFLFRQLTLAFEKCAWWRALPSKLRTSLQYYSFLYVCLACALVLDLIEMGRLLVSHPWLHPTTFAITPGMPQEERNCPRWLRWLSLGTPLAAACSWSIGAYHTIRHARAIRKFGGGLLSTSVQRDRTVQVVAFPAIFSLTSFGAVVELWCLLAGHDSHGMSRRHTRTWSEKEGYVVERYTALFAVAALYEAYALLEFVWLSLDELEANMRITRADAVRAATNFNRQRTASMEALDTAREEPSSSRERADSTDSSTSPQLLEAADPEQQRTVVQVLRSLTMQGVLWFVLTCFLDAIFDLYVVQWAQAHDYSLPPWAEGGEMVFYGMGFLASSAAITNVVSVEASLHAYFGDFRCAPKFLSCKIMVSIAFLQSICVQLLTGVGILSPLQKRLLYSSLICYEVLALSCFHLYAWPEDEPWLQNTERGRKEARARWKYAVSTMSVGQKMIGWLHRARERLAEKRNRAWRRLPASCEEPVTATLSAPAAHCRDIHSLMQPRPFAVPAHALPILPISPSGTPPWYSPRTGSPSPTMGHVRSVSSTDSSPQFLQLATVLKSGSPTALSPKPATPPAVLSPTPATPPAVLSPTPAARSAVVSRPTLLQVPLVTPPGPQPPAISPTYMTRVQSAGPPSFGAMRVLSNPRLVHAAPSKPQAPRSERL